MGRKISKKMNAALDGMNWNKGWVIVHETQGLFIVRNHSVLMSMLRNGKHAIYKSKLIDCKTRRYVTLDQAVHGE